LIDRLFHSIEIDSFADAIAPGDRISYSHHSILHSIY
jgi:hypothetical protein